VIRALRDRFGDRCTTELAARDAHGHDVSHHKSRPPDAVVFPTSTNEVAEIVSLCAAHRVPIIPFGTGTAVEGGVLAVRGGICIDMRRMNRILRVGVDDRDVTVEAGVTRHELIQHLIQLGCGLFFPVDPGADASLGGMAATRASGSAAVYYGTMRDNVLGLTVVLADGRVIRTGGRARKSSAGYDLTRLLVGSEGTLGIITELTLKLARIPEAISAAVCPFNTIDAAVNAVMAVMAAGIPMARIELLDEVQIDAVNRYSGLKNKVSPTLFLEFQGSKSAVVEQAQAAGEILKRHGGEFAWAADQSERNRLLKARHDAYYASLALRPGGVGYVTDVCVPISQLAECIARAKRQIANTKIPAPLFGHVGDGNFHVVFIIDPNNAEELREVEEHSRNIVAHALELGGTCTGEHGIGLGKLDALEQEFGPAVDVMRSIKQALDPHGLLNPGKVVRISQ
jgi:D-lactate dehydrogenase (cytochrome)